ncbi:MAG: peptidylprolyl isomerase [Putridiphycobacter sp.]
MAVIGKIQKNSILLLIIIGGAMLAFIFTDMLRNVGGGEEPTPTATLYGEPIDDKELNDLEESFINREKQNYFYQQKEFTEQAKKSAEDQAFNEYVRKTIMDKELDALGIEVTDNELTDMVLGNHVHPWISSERAFQNSLGQYSKDSLVKYLDMLEMEPTGEDPQEYEQWESSKQAWTDFEQQLADARKADKYVTLVKKGLFVNSLEAKSQYVAANERRTISYVVKKYVDMDQSEVELTDEDLKAYYEEHKNDKQYEQTDETAIIDYVEFPVMFTQNDVEDALTVLEGYKEAFKKSENDISYMYNKSDIEFYSDSTIFKLGSDQFDFNPSNPAYALVADEAIQAADSGDVVGPFVAGDQAALLKVKGFVQQEQAWVRHILISTGAKRTDAVAKKTADSLISVIKANNNFVEMVTAVSEDPGSIQNGGEYKWFPKGMMVSEFENAAFNGQKGKLQLVKTNYGYHIVEVLGQRNAKLPILAPIVKTIKPSQETKMAIEEIAYEFIEDYEQTEGDSAFYQVAKDKGLLVMNSRMSMKSAYVMGFDDNNNSKIKKFAFAKDAVEGDVSTPILDQGTYKVAFLVSKMGEGVPEFEAIKEQMRFPALREKQAEHFKQMLAGTQNLQELVAKYPELEIQNATVIFNSNAIQGAGSNEPKVVGSIFSVPQDLTPLLAPIDGNSGVYVVRINGVDAAAETTDYTAEQKSLQASRQSNADNAVIRALREKADVKDNRAKVDIQGR